MCDFSLETYRNRPASAGERYITHRFPSSSIGLVSPGDCMTAVCVQPDTKLVLEGLPEIVQRQLGLGDTEEAIFVRLDQHERYRDGVRFRNGRVITLQMLGTGVGVRLIASVEDQANLDAELVMA